MISTVLLAVFSQHSSPDPRRGLERNENLTCINNFASFLETFENNLNTISSKDSLPFELKSISLKIASKARVCSLVEICKASMFPQ